ncbi:XdhC family protein [Paraburkholderia tropica]|uniref:XdhC family protein n=1 Tax=Paraburkholderia tropica TaxID=92647 RepID=UPI002AAFE16B|nr:XdhC family protein [Paraburkholderia tropica]
MSLDNPVLNAELAVFESASEWLAQGHRVYLFTVVRTWGSSPRPIGSIMVLRDDGRVAGSVSGGCIEDDLIDGLQRDGQPGEQPARVTYGLNADEAHRFGLPCGGTLELVRETVRAADLLALLARLRRGQLVRRRVDLDSGHVELGDALADTPQLVCDEQRLAIVHGPTWRMLLIGAGHLSNYVANMAIPLGYAVSVCEPRSEYWDEWRVPGARLVTSMPDDTVIDMQLDQRSVVLALTHDPKLDDLALIEALESPAFYVGAIGSRRNSHARRERLALFGLAAASLARLHAPVGLHLGGTTPPEIALSIVAAVTAARHRVPVTQLRDVRAGKSALTESSVSGLMCS